MRRTTPLLFIVAFLQACATGPKAEPAPEPGPPPPEKVTPAAVTAPVWKVDAGLEKSYRSSMAQCVDGALKVCRERDYRIRSQQKTADGVTIAAEGRQFEFTLAIARTPENRTRVVLRTSGRAAPEHRSEAIAVLNKLSDTLLEPRD
jgi:hypothetical protein